jgi:hypothetical protein
VSEVLVIALTIGIGASASVALLGYLAYLLVFYKLTRDGKSADGLASPERVFRRHRSSD